jgi:hypothetical protein
VLGTLPACLGDATPESGGDAVAEATSPLVGRWTFVYDDAVRARVETGLAATVAPGDLEAAKRAAEAEAAASMIELTDEGQLFSWVEGDLHASSTYVAEATGPATYRVSRAAPDGSRETTTVTLESAYVMIIDDPAKGPLRFRRVVD